MMRIRRSWLLTAAAAAIAVGGTAEVANAAPPAPQITFVPSSLTIKAGAAGPITASVTNADAASHQMFALLVVLPPDGVTLGTDDMSISWDPGNSPPVPQPLAPDPTGTLPPNAKIAVISANGFDPMTWTLDPQQTLTLPLVISLARTAPIGDLNLGVAVSSTTDPGQDAAGFARLTVQPPDPTATTTAPTPSTSPHTSPPPRTPPPTTPPGTGHRPIPPPALQHAASHLAGTAAHTVATTHPSPLAATGPPPIGQLGIAAVLLLITGTVLTLAGACRHRIPRNRQ